VNHVKGRLTVPNVGPVPGTMERQTRGRCFPRSGVDAPAPARGPGVGPSRWRPGLGAEETPTVTPTAGSGSALAPRTG